MNNPYRARPGRLRADHTATAGVPKYGVQNQNSWSSMVPNTQSANVYSSQSVVNQTNEAGDPWDWGSENIDNGNDAWNWSIDQPTEAQSQSHQQQSQQPQFIPTYSNLRPHHQNLAQDNYYTNINGNNNRTIPPQSQLSDGITPRTGPSRESTPSHSDSYNQYTKYNLNQQPPRTNSTKSCSSISENQNIKHFNNYFQPTSPFDLNNQTSHSQQFPSNNYNWNGVDQSNIPGQNWQNQAPDTPTYWQDQSFKKEEVAPADNQWVQVQHQQQQPQHYQQQHHQQQQLKQQPQQQLNQDSQQEQFKQQQQLNQHPQQQQLKQQSSQQQLNQDSQQEQFKQLQQLNQQPQQQKLKQQSPQQQLNQDSQQEQFQQQQQLNQQPQQQKLKQQSPQQQLDQDSQREQFKQQQQLNQQPQQQQLKQQSPPQQLNQDSQREQFKQQQQLNQQPQQQQLKQQSPPQQLNQQLPQQQQMKPSPPPTVSQNWHGNLLETNQLRRLSQEAVLSNQWYEHNHENRTVDQKSQQNNYLQSENSNSNLNQSWQHVPLHQTSMWPEKSPEVENKLTDISLDSFPEENTVLQKDWQSVETSSINYASSTREIVSTINKTEDSRLEEQIPVFSVPENHANKSTFIPGIESNLFEPQRLENRSSTDLINVKESTEASWSAERDTNSLSDLTTGVNQLNLTDNPHKTFENSKLLFSPQFTFEMDSRPSLYTSHSIVYKSQENLTVSNQRVAQLPVHPQDHPIPVSLSVAHDSSRSHLSQDHTSLAQIGVQSHLRQQEHPSVYTSPTVLTALHSQEFSPPFPGPMMHAKIQRSHSLHSELLENASPLQPYLKASVESLHISPESISNEESKQSSSSAEATSPQAAEIVSPTSYDTWYNQKTVRTSSQSNWYPNAERTIPGQTWAPESADNYEMKSSTDFINVDSSSSNSHEQISVTEPVVEESKASTPPKEAYQPLQQPLQSDLHPENYEFASNDRNTFLETGELTDTHHEHESVVLQEDENDEVPSDIPFIREVPGQSSSIDPRRNPTGQEEYLQLQSSPRLVDPRRNDISAQVQGLQTRQIPLERSERRDVPPGQERRDSGLSPRDTETLERRNDPSGREQSLPPSQSRNDPSGEERTQNESQIILESAEVREIPGSRVDFTESTPSADGIRQITGGISVNEPTAIPDNNARVVPGSQETVATVKQDTSSETRNKREEAVGASIREDPALVSSSPKRRDSYEDGDDEESGNSREDNRERRRDQSPSDRRRYDYDRKGDRSDRYYDRDRKYDDDYFYERRRGGHDYDRPYNSREDLDRRETSFREGDRRHASRDDLDDRRRLKDDDERDGRRRDDRRSHWDDSRRRDGRDYDPKYPLDARSREHIDRDRRRDGRRRWYDDYDPRDPRRDYFDDPYAKGSRPSSRSSYNDRERDYYMRARDPYYGYNADTYGAYDYGANYYAYLENLRRTNPTAYMEWYNKYYASQQQQHPVARGASTYPEDRASVHSGRSSCEDRFARTPTIGFRTPNKALYAPYFGCTNRISSPVRRKRPNCCRNLNRITSGKQTIGDMSLLEDARAVSRLTPTKFSTSHVQGSFSVGSLVHVHASYPAEGERARVDIVRLDSLLMHDSVTRELRTYPGPLIKGVTHKKTIIEYCEAKIKKAPTNDELIDHASYILLYQLMIMLIQQNGNVVGVDIATLLLRNKETYPYEVNKVKYESVRRESTISQKSGGAGREGSVHEDAPQEVENTKQQKTVEQMTNEFRNTLIYGLVQEALEYAMTEGLWGHALFLASKLDKRTHASVMTRFANSLPAQDPLQTLYQLHSGRVPASVTCVSDPKWDDWRPHLAMVISNTSANPEINRRAITTLGDTLVARGEIHAAHFCYILAQIEFGTYGTSGVKLVLIGANHHKPYSDFATPEAIMLTEIYEYARNLSESGFTLIGLQTYKLEMAQKMVDYGLIEKALLYLEQIAVNIVKEPSKYKQSFVNDVYTLSERIKFHDPVFKDCIEDETTLAWLYNLREIVDRCQAGEIVQDINNARVDSQNGLPDTDQREVQPQPQPQQQQQQWNYTGNQDYGAAPASMMEIPTIDASQDQWQPMSLPPTIQDTYSTDQNAQYKQNIDVNQYHQQSQDYWGQQAYNQQDYAKDYSTGDWQQQQANQIYPQDQNDVDSSQQPGGWNYESEKEEKLTTPEPKPQISMGPSTAKQYDPLEELDALESPSESSKSAAEAKKSQEKQAEKKASNSGGSWFGGLFSKLTPKPKNQMILPDDNNPTIVWDPVAKKWVNKDENGDSASSRFAPPPKMAELNLNPSMTAEQNPSMQEPTVRPPSADSTTPNTSKMISGSSNMFKLQKGRNMRANYIDVMNPNGVKSNGPPSTIPTPTASPLMQPIAASSPQLFVPSLVNDPNAPVDFLTPTPTTMPSTDTTSQGLSRWSSASSLSREVQSYTMRDPRHHQRIKGPMMYNPAEVKENSMKNMPRSRYPPR